MTKILAALVLLTPLMAAAESIQVFVSVAPQAYLVERIGGERVSVRVMVPTGRSPHAYEPLPRQLGELSRAQAYFRVGVPFENGMLNKIGSSHSRLQIVDMRQGVAMLEGGCGHDHGHSHQHDHERGRADPHIWLDPQRLRVQARTAADALCRLDPDHAVWFRDNLKRLDADIMAIDQRIATALAPLRGKSFLVFHPAFGYFADRYGLKQLAVETDGKEPGARHVAELIRRARREHIRVVFVQTGFSRTGARTIAAEIDGAVITMDPLAENVLDNLEAIAARLGDALSR